MAEIVINSPGVKAIRLQEEHLDGIVELMNKEGWYYYDRHELNRYLTLNQDCFTLVKDGRIIGSIFTTNYGNQAWIGNIIVAEQARGMGLASQLIRGAIDYLQEEKKIFTFRLGSVPLAIGLYKKIGFQAEAFTTAQEAPLPLKVDYQEIHLGESIRVEKLHDHDLHDISEIDQRYFKSNRKQFLADIFNNSIKDSCFCLKDQGRVVGFLMVRRRQASKGQGCFDQGPDYAYRLGPSCVMPDYGINGFKALFQETIQAVNEEVAQLAGNSKIYAVFPKNADKEEIYQETQELARAMGMDGNMDLDHLFDQHDHIFGARKSTKNEEQWHYMVNLGFHQEYFEQIMNYTPGEATQARAVETKAEPEGIFGAATPGDKA